MSFVKSTAHRIDITHQQALCRKTQKNVI